MTSTTTDGRGPGSTPSRRWLVTGGRGMLGTDLVERLGRDGVRLALVRDGRVFSTLRPRRCELLPHSAGIAVFAYRGHVRGAVLARVELPAPLRGASRSFRLRL